MAVQNIRWLNSFGIFNSEMAIQISIRLIILYRFLLRVYYNYLRTLRKARYLINRRYRRRRSFISPVTQCLACFTVHAKPLYNIESEV